LPGDHFTVQAAKKITKNAVEALQRANVEAVEISDAELEGAFAASDVVDPSTGEVILEANEPLEPRVISMAQEKNVDKIEIFFPEKDEVGNVLSATLKKDPIHTHEEALIEIYRRLRPGDPPTLDSSRSLFENMFFNPQKYDFSRVGRLKLNTKLKLNTPLDEKILHPQDFYEVIKYLLKLRRFPANVDDIDHLGNRRVRSGFEVSDVHPPRYSRICPIETPEGPNIGLISSLSCYARINEFGFIESPYRKVKDGRVVDYVVITNAAGNAKYKVGDVVE